MLMGMIHRKKHNSSELINTYQDVLQEFQNLGWVKFIYELLRSSQQYWCCIFSNINGEMAHIGDLEFQMDKVLIAHSGESIANAEDCTLLVNESSKVIDI